MNKYSKYYSFEYFKNYNHGWKDLFLFQTEK